MIICLYALVSDMPKQKYQSHFQDIWLEDEQFKQWPSVKYARKISQLGQWV